MDLRVRTLVLLMLTVPAATAAQPLSVTASVAVTWLDRVDAELAPPTLGEPVSLGSVFPPAVVVLWRGQPGWAFEAATEKVSFSSSGGWPGGRRSTSVMQGRVRLELTYAPATLTRHKLAGQFLYCVTDRTHQTRWRRATPRAVQRCDSLPLWRIRRPSRTATRTMRSRYAPQRWIGLRSDNRCTLTCPRRSTQPLASPLTDLLLMDASEFKEFILGMLFLNRLSDEFDRKREPLRKKTFAHLKDQPDLVAELLEDKTSYGETFFVPVRARWHEPWKDDNDDLVPALKDIKHDIGNMLNKAIAVIEGRRVKTGLMQDLLTGNRRVTALLKRREAVTT